MHSAHKGLVMTKNRHNTQISKSTTTPTTCASSAHPPAVLRGRALRDLRPARFFGQLLIKCLEHNHQAQLHTPAHYAHNYHYFLNSGMSVNSSCDLPRGGAYGFRAPETCSGRVPRRLRFNSPAGRLEFHPVDSDTPTCIEQYAQVHFREV